MSFAGPLQKKTERSELYKLQGEVRKINTQKTV